MVKGRLAWVGWLLVVLAVVLSTATYAWVTINTSASMRGFILSAESDSLFLEISADQGEYKEYGTGVYFDRVVYAVDPETHEIFLVTCGFVPSGGAAIVTETAITEGNANAFGNGGKYDGSGSFYAAADSDVTDGTDSFRNITSNLNVGDSLVGYYSLMISSAPETAEAGRTYYMRQKCDSGGYHYVCLGEIPEGEALEGHIYWGYAFSDTEGDPQPRSMLNVISTSDPGEEYVLRESVYLRCAKNTLDATNLRISEIKINGLTDYMTGAIRVLVVANSDRGKTKTVIYNPKDNPNPDEILLEEVYGNQGEVVTVDIYIYFDGTDDEAYSQEGVLSTHTVDIVFTIDDHEYN